MTNICLIGHFGGEEPFFEGQTVKTRTLEEALRRYGPQLRLFKVDTYDFQKNKGRFFRSFLVGVLSCNRILLCVSKRGRKLFFPVLYILAKLFRKRVFHCAIGGRLADEAGENKKIKKYVSSFRKNWVESQALAERLRSQGIENAAYLPNFKALPVLTPQELPRQVHDPLRCIIFSRISAKKGIGDALEAVREINEKMGRTAVTLELYGPIQEDFAQELERGIRACGQAVRYCGTVQPSESVSVIKNRDVLLFPTRYQREGIPGTIIDALASGVPVIARRWRYCDEMLTHGVTGYCYDFDQPQLLEYWLEYALSHREELAAMKENCLNAARQYDLQTVAPVLIRELLEE